MCAHYRIVTENASLGQPEVKLGIIPGYGGMQRLPRLVGPARAAIMSVNGEPVDGHTAVAWGLADEFVSSATALSAAVRRARECISGERSVPRKDWDGIAAGQKEALDRFLERVGIREILSATPPGTEEAKDIRTARTTAARGALLAMKYGYENGFSAGLANDARAFGEITASPGGQEWVGRFLNKDPKQSSFLLLIPGEET
jgi:enoyl-CoA hydratase/carnithine racemase